MIAGSMWAAPDVQCATSVGTPAVSIVGVRCASADVELKRIVTENEIPSRTADLGMDMISIPGAKTFSSADRQALKSARQTAVVAVGTTLSEQCCPNEGMDYRSEYFNPQII
jgi:hypothetical protein